MVHMKELLEGSPKRYRPRWSEKNSMRYIALIVCPFFCLFGSRGGQNLSPFVPVPVPDRDERGTESLPDRRLLGRDRGHTSPDPLTGPGSRPRSRSTIGDRLPPTGRAGTRFSSPTWVDDRGQTLDRCAAPRQDPAPLRNFW